MRNMGLIKEKDRYDHRRHRVACGEAPHSIQVTTQKRKTARDFLGGAGAYLSRGMALGNMVGGLWDRELRRAKQLGIS